MPARIRKIQHDERTRQKIKTSQLANRLTDHVLGKVDMSPSQVSAALGLLRKTLPDLQQTDMNVKGELESGILALISGLDSRTIAEARQAVADRAEEAESTAETKH